MRHKESGSLSLLALAGALVVSVLLWVGFAWVVYEIVEWLK